MKRVLQFLIVSIGISFSSLNTAQTDLLAGVYSQSQAARGEEQYRARCVSCHGNDLRGNSNSPGLVGLSFLFLWEGRTIGELFEKMRNEMPTDNPASLPAQSYSDILAYILSVNGYPAGDADLGISVEAMKRITIVATP